MTSAPQAVSLLRPADPLGSISFFISFYLKETFTITKSECCLRDHKEFGEPLGVRVDLEPAWFSAGSLPLKMTLRCSFVSVTEHGAESCPPCDTES